MPMPARGADGERPADPGGGAGDGIVEQQPGVDPSHPVHEPDLVDAVVDTLERLPVGQLDGGVDGPLGRGHLFVRIEGCAVLGSPALHEHPRHGAYGSRALGRFSQGRRVRAGPYDASAWSSPASRSST